MALQSSLITMEPFSLATGVVSLVGFALQLVTSALGMTDNAVAAQDEAADELKKLKGDLEDLQAKMTDVHTTLKVLASNTKDRAFKKLLRNEDSNAALAKLCLALEETFVLLERLTDQTEAQESRLDSLSLPDDTRSLAFVQAIFKHNLAPSKTTNLVKSLRDMRSEIQMCLRKLDTAFEHCWKLYTAMSNGLARVATNQSTFSTSTTLTARIKFVDWLNVREGTWGISRQKKGAITIEQVINGALAPTAPTERNFWKEAEAMLPKGYKVPKEWRTITIDGSLVVGMVNHKLKECEDKPWTITLHGKEVLIHDLFNKTLAWVQKFVAVADPVIPYVPHAAPFWAGLCSLLQFAANGTETYGAMLAGVERATWLTSYCFAQERLYKEYFAANDKYSALNDAFVKDLVDLYAALLKFLIDAHSYFAKSPAVRIASSVLTRSTWPWVTELVQAIDERKGRMEDYESLVHKSNVHQDLKNVLGMSELFSRYMSEEAIRDESM